MLAANAACTGSPAASMAYPPPPTAASSDHEPDHRLWKPSVYRRSRRAYGEQRLGCGVVRRRMPTVATQRYALLLLLFDDARRGADRHQPPLAGGAGKWRTAAHDPASNPLLPVNGVALALANAAHRQALPPHHHHCAVPETLRCQRLRLGGRGCPRLGRVIRRPRMRMVP